MSLSLLDWRRRVASLYRDVREEPSPVTAWTRWQAGRAELLRAHPDSPLHPGGALPTYAPYDPSL